MKMEHMIEIQKLHWPIERVAMETQDLIVEMIIESDENADLMVLEKNILEDMAEIHGVSPEALDQAMKDLWLK